MEKYQLSIRKSTLDLLYEALNNLKKGGMLMLGAEEQCTLAKRVDKRVEDDKAKNTKTPSIMDGIKSEMGYITEETFKLSEAKFQKASYDLDIIIAKVQLVRKNIEEQHDEYLVDDLLKEIHDD